MGFKDLFLMVLVLALWSCSAPLSDGTDLIGSELTSSALASDQSQAAAIYDIEAGVIQEFHLQTMALNRQIEVQNSSLKHTVLISSAADYIVDFTAKHMAIYPNGGESTIDPIRLVGTPKSAAYHAGTEAVAVYDDLASVGLLKMSNGGQTVKAWIGGPLIDGSTVQAGDFAASGALVLVFSDNSMATINVETSIDTQSWSFTKLAPALTQPNWVAPVTGSVNSVVTHSNEGLSLVDSSSGTILAQYSTSGLTLLKLSKQNSPHGIFRTSDGALRMVYLDGVAFQDRTLNVSISRLMQSVLDIGNNSWQLIDRSIDSTYSIFNNPNEYLSNRRLLRFRLSDLLSEAERTIFDDAEIGITNEYVLSLFPSQIGYATRMSILSGELLEKTKFNFELFRQRNLR